jgi:hypothetical protein
VTTKARSKLWWRRGIVVAAILLLLAGLWPVVAFVNRIEPFVLGLPFYVFWMVMLDLMVAILLAIAYRKLG